MLGSGRESVWDRGGGARGRGRGSAGGLGLTGSRRGVPVAGHGPSPAAGLCPRLLPYSPQSVLPCSSPAHRPFLRQVAYSSLLSVGSPCPSPGVWADLAGRPHCPPSALQPRQPPDSSAPWAPETAQHGRPASSVPGCPHPLVGFGRWGVGQEVSGAGVREGRVCPPPTPGAAVGTAPPPSRALSAPAVRPCLVNCLNKPPEISPPECLLSGPSGVEGSCAGPSPDVLC